MKKSATGIKQTPSKHDRVAKLANKDLPVYASPASLERTRFNKGASNFDQGRIGFANYFYNLIKCIYLVRNAVLSEIKKAKEGSKHQTKLIAMFYYYDFSIKKANTYYGKTFFNKTKKDWTDASEFTKLAKKTLVIKDFLLKTTKQFLDHCRTKSDKTFCLGFQTQADNKNLYDRLVSALDISVLPGDTTWETYSDQLPAIHKLVQQQENAIQKNYGLVEKENNTMSKRIKVWTSEKTPLDEFLKTLVLEDKNSVLEDELSLEKIKTKKLETQISNIQQKFESVTSRFEKHLAYSEETLNKTLENHKKIMQKFEDKLLQVEEDLKDEKDTTHAFREDLKLVEGDNTNLRAKLKKNKTKIKELKNALVDKNNPEPMLSQQEGQNKKELNKEDVKKIIASFPEVPSSQEKEKKKLEPSLTTP